MLTKIKQEPFRKKLTFKVLFKALLIPVGLSLIILVTVYNSLKDKHVEEKEFLVASTGSEQYCTTYGEHEIRLYVANAQNSKPVFYLSFDTDGNEGNEYSAARLEPTEVASKYNVVGLNSTLSGTVEISQVPEKQKTRSGMQSIMIDTMNLTTLSAELLMLDLLGEDRMRNISVCKFQRGNTPPELISWREYQSRHLAPAQ